MKVPVLPRLVGLAGAPGSGRSTVARYLVDAHDFRSYTVADPVQWLLSHLDPLVSGTESLRSVVDRLTWSGALADRIHGPEVTRLVATLRDGDGGVLFPPDHWVAQAWQLAQNDTALMGPAPVVLADIATPAEAQWVLDRGGVVWQVTRPGCVDTAPLPRALVSTVVRNDATTLALTRRAERALTGAARPEPTPVGVNALEDR